MASEYVDLNLRFEMEGDVWVGHCLELITSTFADTLADCQEALQELAVEHIDFMEEIGERAAFFEERGITLHSARDDAPSEFDIRGGGDFWAGSFPKSPDPRATSLKIRVFFVKDAEREAAGEAAGQLAGV